jgi:hypothetical protein
MIEYVIRIASSHEWPAVHQMRLSEVMIPTGSRWETVEGWGDFRMRLDGTEVSFSGEMGGWQVTIEGPLSEDEVQRTVEIVAAQVQTEVGEPLDVLRLS